MKPEDERILTAFAKRLFSTRLHRLDHFGRFLSQRKAAQLFNVDSSTYANWERARHFPDERAKQKIAEVWPEVFQD